MALKILFTLILGFLTLCLIVCADELSNEENNSVESNPGLHFDFVNEINPLHYDIHLIVATTEKFDLYTGIVLIRFEAKSTTPLFQFIAANTLNISSVNLKNLRTGVDSTNFNLTRETKFYSITDDVFVVSTNGNILEKSEQYEMKVRFSGAMDVYGESRAFFGSQFDVDNVISYFAATHFQTKYIRDAIPTFEDVSFKVPIKLRITHHPKFMALSNMPGRVISGDSMRVTTEFDETPPMPGYILAFAIGQFKSKSIPNQRNLSFTIYGSSKIFNETDDATLISGKILIGMENYFTIPYALPKMDYLIIPDFPFYGMENWGLVVFIESKIFGSWSTKSTGDLMTNTVVNAHELAHQYFGNLVTPKEWRYVWLSEGFATFFSYCILDRVFPNDHYMDQFMVDNFFTTYDLGNYKGDTLNPRTAKSSIYEVAEKINYYKASSIIRMIMHVIGENTFRHATIAYLKRHSYNSTVPSDLIVEYENSLRSDMSWPMDIPIKTFIESWTHQGGTPILTVTRNYVNGDIVLKQNFNTRGSEYDNTQQNWWLPYNYATKSNPDFSNTKPIGWMKDEPNTTINLNMRPHDWIIFNKQCTSLYIVNYDEQNWELLTNELIHGNFEIIHEYNRAQLIHDLSKLVDYEQVNRKVLIKLLMYLKHERKYLPWAAADSVLSDLWATLRNTNFEEKFKKALQHMTGDAYDYYRLNAQEKDAKSALLARSIIVKWACLAGYQNCLHDFETLSAQYLNSVVAPHQQTLFVHPDIKESLLCYGFQNENDFNRIFDYFLANPSHPDQAAFFEQFHCKANTKLFRIYYVISQYAVKAKNMSEFPAFDRVYPSVRQFRGNELQVLYQCFVENCFDFKENSPDKFTSVVSIVVSNVLNPRLVKPENLPTVRLMLEKIEEVYGNETIQKIAEHVNNRYSYYW